MNLPLGSATLGWPAPSLLITHKVRPWRCPHPGSLGLDRVSPREKIASDSQSIGRVMAESR